MKKSLVLLCCVISGCAMTPTQKKVAATVGGMVAIGMVAAHGSKSQPLAITQPSGPPCHPQPDGSCR